MWIILICQRCFPFLLSSFPFHLVNWIVKWPIYHLMTLERHGCFSFFFFFLFKRWMRLYMIIERNTLQVVVIQLLCRAGQCSPGSCSFVRWILEQCGKDACPNIWVLLLILKNYPKFFISTYLKWIELFLKNNVLFRKGYENQRRAGLLNYKMKAGE